MHRRCKCSSSTLSVCIISAGKSKIKCLNSRCTTQLHTAIYENLLTAKEFRQNQFNSL